MGSLNGVMGMCRLEKMRAHRDRSGTLFEEFEENFRYAVR
jgi:hypothetical protein